MEIMVGGWWPLDCVSCCLILELPCALGVMFFMVTCQEAEPLWPQEVGEATF